MRAVKLGLLGLVVWVVGVLILFPAAPIVERIEPQLGPVTLDGVSGPLYSGEIARVNYDDGLLPLEFTDVGWTLDPLSLIKGAGASVRFDGYGGSGAGHVVRTWGGDLAVADFTMNVDARQLESLLPLPIARFSGALSADIESLLLQDELLTELEGTIVWSDAVLEQPLSVSLGTMNLVIVRDGPESHVVEVTAAGGELQMSGTVNVAQDGDYSADLLLVPSDDAPVDVIDGLRRFAREEADGQYRLQQTGNVNRLI